MYLNKEDVLEHLKNHSKIDPEDSVDAMLELRKKEIEHESYNG